MNPGEEPHKPEPRAEPKPRAQPEPRPAREPAGRLGPESERLHRDAVTSERVFGVIYGAIAVGVLLAAEDASRETFPHTVESVAVALTLYWLADSYAVLAVRRIRQGWTLTPRRFGSAMLSELWILIGAAEPIAVLVIFWALGGSLANSETAAIWAAAVVILAVEVLAGVRAQLSGPELFMQSLLGAALGSLVIALSAILH